MTPFKIWPQFGSTSPEIPTPEWNGGYNLLFVEGAQALDLTRWRIDGALISTAVKLPTGLHVNLYPTGYGMVRLYQLDESGRPLGGPTLLACDRPRPVMGGLDEQHGGFVSVAREPTLGTGSKYQPRPTE